MKHCIAILILAALSGLAFSDTLTGKISRIYPQGERVYFLIDGDSCKTIRYWYFTLGDDVSKAWLSLMIAAANTNAEIAVAFAGPCDPILNEEISYIYQNFSN